LEKGSSGYAFKRNPERNFLSRQDKNNKIVMGNGDVLTLNRRSYKNGYKTIKEFEITVSNSAMKNEPYFHLQKRENVETSNVIWIGGSWIFIQPLIWSGGFSQSIANYAIINYKTGEERSFYPEIVAGFGRNMVLTTGRDLIGLTIRTLDNEVVYRDSAFDFGGILRHEEWAYAGRGLGFGYIDLPYVYINVFSRAGGPYVPWFYEVLNLQTGKVYALRHVLHMVGIFE
jgi:hypothetical protein